MKRLHRINLKAQMLGCSGMILMVSMGTLSIGYGVYKLLVA